MQNSLDNLKGGLNKIAQQLRVERYGDIHQAGSDSIVTAEVFFKILSSNLISKEDTIMKKNILFGIGLGTDDNETFNYTQFAPGVILNYSNGNSFNNSNSSFDQYSQMMPSMYSQGSSSNMNQYNYEQGQGKRFPYGMMATYGN